MELGSIGLVTSGSLLARVLGFARELLLAFFLGTETQAEAYYVAAAIADLGTALVIGGGVAAGFMPILSRLLEQEPGMVRAYVARSILLFGGVATVVSGVLYSVSPVLLPRMAPGLGEEALVSGVAALRVGAFAVVPLAVASVLTAVHHAHGRFGPPVLSAAIQSTVVLGAMLLLLRPLGALGGTLSLLAGAAVVPMVLWTTLDRLPSSTPASRFAAWRHAGEATRLAVPVFLLTALMRSPPLISRFFASDWEGGAAAVGYAEKVALLPFAFFGMAAATVMYPSLSRLAAAGDVRGVSISTHRVVGGIVIVLGPLIVLQMSCADVIVDLIFARGNFGQRSADLTAAFLAGAAFAGVGLSLMEVAFRGFYALRRPWIPACVVLTVLATHAGLSVLLYSYGSLGLGIAWGSAVTVGGLIAHWVLHIVAHREIRMASLSKIGNVLAGVLAAGLLGALAAVALPRFLDPIPRLLVMGVVCLTAMALGVQHVRLRMRFGGDDSSV